MAITPLMPVYPRSDVRPVRGEGAYLYGENGEQYLDFAAGIAVNVLGHGLGGSRYLKVCHGLKIGPTPNIDLTHEIKVQSAVRDLIRAGLVQSAHDCSEGGLAVAVAESCFNPEWLFGAEIDCSRRPVGDVTVVSTTQAPRFPQGSGYGSKLGERRYSLTAASAETIRRAVIECRCKIHRNRRTRR